MKLTHRIGAVAALSALLLASGCGGGGDKGSKADAAKSASASAAAAFAKKPGQDIADAAKADMQGLKAVHYAGSISASSGDITLDIQAKSDGDCSGKVGLGSQGGNATVLSAGGTSWFKGDLAFWQSAVGDQAQQVVSTIGDKWVLDSDNNFKQFCDLDEFFSGLFSATAGSTYTTKGTDTVDGQDVVLVERSDATDGPSTGYVLTGAKHYLVKIERTGGSGNGALTFDAFDKDFDVTAPAASDVVDPSTLQQGQ